MSGDKMSFSKIAGGGDLGNMSSHFGRGSSSASGRICDPPTRGRSAFPPGRGWLVFAAPDRSPVAHTLHARRVIVYDGAVRKLLLTGRQVMMSRNNYMAFVLCLVCGVVGSPLARAEQSACAKLNNLKIDETTITSAELVPAGSFSADSRGKGFSATDLPEFCRVQATAKPTPDSEIRLEVCDAHLRVEREV